MGQRTSVAKGVTFDPSFAGEASDVEEEIDSDVGMLPTGGYYSVQSSNMWWSGTINSGEGNVTH